MIVADRFVVFIREGDSAWSAIASLDSLGLAVAEADSLCDTHDDDRADRAVVMEITGKDSLPQFTYRYGAVRKSVRAQGIT